MKAKFHLRISRQWATCYETSREKSPLSTFKEPQCSRKKKSLLTSGSRWDKMKSPTFTSLFKFQEHRNQYKSLPELLDHWILLKCATKSWGEIRSLYCTGKTWDIDALLNELFPPVGFAREKVEGYFYCTRTWLLIQRNPSYLNVFYSQDLVA